MKRYRLKKEAVPFFLDKHATAIYYWDTWKELQVDDKALEEVEDVFISYGKPLGENGKSLSGWGQEEKAHFHFTINFPSMKNREYDEFHKGHHIRKFMDKIQNMADNYFKDFVNNDLEE